MEKKILFVDDEHSILRLYKTFALGRGYVPYCAASGDEALRIMVRENIRVFCLDLSMPEMDGFELCRRIKKIDPVACVYAVSGYAEGASPGKFESAGFDGLMGKPVRFDMMFKSCQVAFEKIARWEKRNGEACDGVAQSGASVKTVTPAEHQKLIEYEAYLLAEKNNFKGDPAGYWAQAEKLVSMPCLA
jgi:CheY-like chemotaxis protein